MSTAQIDITACGSMDSLQPDANFYGARYIGQLYISDTKALNRRAIFRADLSSLAGWTNLTAAKLRGNVDAVAGAQFAATLRRVTEEFDYTQATYNARITGTNWATAGADTPNSATDTNKVGFTSPAATGIQDIVTGLLTLVNESIASYASIFRFHIRSDNESPGVNTYFRNASLTGDWWYLEIEGTAPAAGAKNYYTGGFAASKRLTRGLGF